MGDLKVSIIMSTIDNRVELLERSLWTYARQDYSPVEVIIVADRPKSTRTKEMVEGYRDRLDVKYFEIGGPEGWRNGYGQNRGIAESVGDVLLITHPEVMFESDNVRLTIDRLNGEDMVCAMLMWTWTTEAMTNWIAENQEWRENVRMLREVALGPLNKGFDELAQEVLHAIKVAPSSSCTFWQSMAMTRKTWFDIGGFTLMNSKNSMDEDLIRRKEVLGIPTRIVRAFSYHQYHPWGPVNNPLEVFEYNKPEDAIRELRWE